MEKSINQSTPCSYQHDTSSNPQKSPLDPITSHPEPWWAVHPCQSTADWYWPLSTPRQSAPNSRTPSAVNFPSAASTESPFHPPVVSAPAPPLAPVFSSHPPPRSPLLRPTFRAPISAAAPPRWNRFARTGECRRGWSSPADGPGHRPLTAPPDCCPICGVGPTVSPWTRHRRPRFSGPACRASRRPRCSRSPRGSSRRRGRRAGTCQRTCAVSCRSPHRKPRRPRRASRRSWCSERRCVAPGWWWCWRRCILHTTDDDGGENRQPGNF